jgi:hypoxanthine phosphoribosyltransferase
MGAQLTVDYRDTGFLALVVLRGSFIFAADLLRQVDDDLPVHVDFVRASSYGNATESTGRVEIPETFTSSLAHRHVLIVEDIVDTGRTLDAICNRVAESKPATVRVAALLHKKDKSVLAFPLAYVGFHIPDVFVVGYGLDYAEAYRHLSDIRILGGETMRR